MADNSSVGAAAGIFDKADVFPIGELSRRTQINSVTLRAWERRYGLLKPSRTAKGHRLYTAADVDTVDRVLALVARGVPLGKVKPLLLSSEDSTVEPSADDWSVLRADLMAAVEALSENKVETIIHRTLLNYPVDVCQERLLSPLFMALAADKHSAVMLNFLESEWLRYTVQRLNSQSKKQQKRGVIRLIAAANTSIWQLAGAALALSDKHYSVSIFIRPFTLVDVVSLAERSDINTYTVYCQDGVWKNVDCQLAATALHQHRRLYLCGTAPALASLSNDNQVFDSVKSCAESLLLGDGC